jgi:hypothetical protein
MVCTVKRGEFLREGVEVGSDLERARDDENCRPFPTAR